MYRSPSEAPASPGAWFGGRGRGGMRLDALSAEACACPDATIPPGPAVGCHLRRRARDPNLPSVRELKNVFCATGLAAEVSAPHGAAPCVGCGGVYVTHRGCWIDAGAHTPRIFMFSRRHPRRLGARHTTARITMEHTDSVWDGWRGRPVPHLRWRQRHAYPSRLHARGVSRVSAWTVSLDSRQVG